MNKVILMGVLVADPEFSQTTSGIPVCKFRIAVDKPVANGQERQSDFFRITAWRGTAELISRYYSKGRSIMIEGSIHNADYTDSNGVKQYSMNITAEKVCFISLTQKDIEAKNSRMSNIANNGGGYGNNYQQQQPSYNNNNGGGFAPQNNNFAPPQNNGYQQPVPNQQFATQPPVSNDFPAGNSLSDFEEVLSDGDVPF